MLYAIILGVAAFIMTALFIAITLIKRHKHNKAVQLEKEKFKEAQKATEIPNISTLTVVTLDENDPVLQHFPYILSLINIKYINVSDVRIFVTENSHPLYASVTISDGSFLTEHCHNGYTTVVFHDDNGETTQMTTENMFKR